MSKKEEVVILGDETPAEVMKQQREQYRQTQLEKKGVAAGVAPGKDGKDGRGISSVEASKVVDGKFTLTFKMTDDTEEEVEVSMPVESSSSKK